jgi:hypothetical protein
MATRFYLSHGPIDTAAGATSAPPVSPTFDTSYEVNTSATRRYLTLTHNSGDTVTSVTSDASSAVQDILVRQFVSPPLLAQTITGNVKGQIRGNESNAAADGVVSLSVQVYSNDGTVLRGTLLAETHPSLSGNEYTTTLTNRNHLVSTALSSLTVLQGDRLVVHVGWHQGAVSASRTVVQSFGSSSATDLAEDQTTTTANNPWIEFDTAISVMPVHLFSDNFDDNSLDTVKWSSASAGSATVAEQSARIELAMPASATSASLARIFGNDYFDLTGSGCVINVVQAYLVTTSADAFFELCQLKGFERLGFLIEAGTLYAQKRVANTNTNLANIAYNATTMAWLRIRESAGTSYWDYSTDSVTWTNLFSVANPITVTSLNVRLSGACFQNETNAGTYIIGSVNSPVILPKPGMYMQAINRASTY